MSGWFAGMAPSQELLPHVRQLSHFPKRQLLTNLGLGGFLNKPKSVKKRLNGAVTSNLVKDPIYLPVGVIPIQLHEDDGDSWQHVEVLVQPEIGSNVSLGRPT